MLLGFDIGGTKCAVITVQWCQGELKIVNKKKIPTDLTIAPEKMITRLIELADSILKETPEAIGVSCGGPLDSERGVIQGPPGSSGIFAAKAWDGACLF